MKGIANSRQTVYKSYSLRIGQGPDNTQEEQWLDISERRGNPKVNSLYCIEGREKLERQRTKLKRMNQSGEGKNEHTTLGFEYYKIERVQQFGVINKRLTEVRSYGVLLDLFLNSMKILSTNSQYLM